MIDWYNFISGAIFATFATIGLFFLRYYVRTRDWFFMYFAMAFWTLAIERLITVGAILTEAQRPLLYLARLFAFSFILWAIWQKNRSASMDDRSR